MKQAYIKTRQTAEEQTNTEYQSAEQYANDEAERNTEQAAVGVAVAAKKAADTIYHRKSKRKATADNPIAEETETPSEKSPNIKQKRAGKIKTRQSAVSRENAIKINKIL